MCQMLNKIMNKFRHRANILTIPLQNDDMKVLIFI
jgi:hypothetical protein